MPVLEAWLDYGIGIAVPIVCAALGLTACAPGDYYAGISRRPGVAPVDLPRLASRAQAGDQQAQLELGIRYEEGVGVPVDRKRAASLYRQAAADSGGPLWVYRPPVGAAAGRIVPVDGGLARAGLPDAKERVRRLSGASAGPRVARPQDSAMGDPPQATDTPLVVSFEEGKLLVSACRTRIDLDVAGFVASDPANFGYCQGYVASKLGRLSSERLGAIDAGSAATVPIPRGPT